METPNCIQVQLRETIRRRDGNTNRLQPRELLYKEDVLIKQKQYYVVKKNNKKLEICENVKNVGGTSILQQEYIKSKPKILVRLG